MTPPRLARSARLEGSTPELAVPYLLKSLHHTLRQVVDQAFRRARLDISFAHLATLFELEGEQGVVGAELARRTFVTAQTMNSILHRLEREGLVERRPHPATRRADRWFMTRQGRKQLEAAQQVALGVWRTMLATLAPRETAQLQDLLQRCVAGLEAQTSRTGRAKRRTQPTS